MNIYKHSSTKSKPTTTNLVIYLDLITPLVGSQRQVGAIYFDLSNAFDLIPHTYFFISLVLLGFLVDM
jgi:hypothetical protein